MTQSPFIRAPQAQEKRMRGPYCSVYKGRRCKGRRGGVLSVDVVDGGGGGYPTQTQHTIFWARIFFLESLSFSVCSGETK